MDATVFCAAAELAINRYSGSDIRDQTFGIAVCSVIGQLEREPLRNIVLLKHLEAFPDKTRVHQVSSENGQATLVLLEVAASAYDRRTYPTASFVAMISSDHPSLTSELLSYVPQDLGIVFKLFSDADRDVIQSVFPVQRMTQVYSYTALSDFSHDHGVKLTSAPTAEVFGLFEAQEHDRNWLEPLIEANRAFVCTLDLNGSPIAVCFAFQNYRRVWEVGGLFTLPGFRGRGFAARVARTAIAELKDRKALPRYQVHDDNIASIRLAEAIGLTRFLTTAHFLRAPVIVNR